MIARSEISHSGRFSETSMTRSPGASPMRFSAEASRATLSAVSRQLIDRHEPSFLAQRKGASPFSFARAKNIATRFGKCSSCRITSPARLCRVVATSVAGRVLLRHPGAFAARIGGADPAAVDALDRIGLVARRDDDDLVPHRLKLR